MADLDSRIRSLPGIICRAANGEGFLVNLSDVQRSMLKHRYKAKTSNERSYLTRCTSKVAEKYKAVDGYPVLSPAYERQTTKPFTPQLTDEFFLADPEVIYRVNQTIRSVEKRREAIAAEANNVRPQTSESLATDPVDAGDDDALEAEAKSSVISDSDDSLSIRHLLTGRDEDTTVATAPLGRASVIGRQSEFRERVSFGNAPEQCAPDDVFTMDEMRLHADNIFQNREQLKISGAGTFNRVTLVDSRRQLPGLYEARCCSLMLIPLTRVIKGLKQEDCLLDHTRIAREGAEALGHALSVNNIVKRLSLVDCSLDSKAVHSIVEGLKCGVGGDTTYLRQLTSSFARPSAVLRSFRGANARTRLGSTMVANLLGEDLQRLKQMVRDPETKSGSTVTSLDMSQNLIGVVGGRYLATLLDPDASAWRSLHELSLVKTGLGDDGALAIARALVNGNTSLTRLDLSANNLSNKSAAAIGELFESNHSMKELNLSWNTIKAGGAGSLAKGLMTNGSLQKLDLSWNGLENYGAMQFGEMLSINLGLKSLNLMHTRTGTEGSLVIAEGLKANNTLERICLDGNPIGEFGARHLMHAISQNKSLKYLGLQGSNMSSIVADGEAESAKFNPACPDGSYQLDLSNQTDRTVAVQLCQLGGPQSLSLMRNVSLNGKDILPKNLDWPNRLPTQGLLKLDYVSSSTRRTMAVIDNKKITALASQFCNPSMSDADRLGIVAISAPYHFFLCHQIRQILEKFSISDERLEAAMILFTRAVDTDDYLEVMLSPLHDRERGLFFRNVAFYTSYVFSNPTGHYELNLTLPLHRLIATRLKDCAFSEAEGPVWNNILYDEYSKQLRLASNYGPPEKWKTMIPTVGTLSLDYVTLACIPEEAHGVSEEALQQLLEQKIHVQFEGMPRRPLCAEISSVADTQIMNLRREMTNRFVSCDQLLKILSCFKHGPQRVEAVVCCYGNLLDRENFWTVLYGLNGLEQAVAVIRLCPVNCFTPHRSSLHWVLDVANPHHAEIAKKLVKAASADTELPNLWNIRLNGKKKQITENANLWAVLTTDTFTPLLEFDFIGSDTWKIVFDLSAEDLADLSVGERLEMRKQYAARLETARLRQITSYFSDGSGYRWGEWQTRAGLMQPLLEKSPWQSVWDRLLRRLVRLAARLGEIEGASPLEDIFNNNATDGGVLPVEDFAEVMKSMGNYKRELEIYESRALQILAMENRSDSPSSSAERDLRDGLRFSEFVELFMGEIPPFSVPDLKSMVMETIQFLPGPRPLRMSFLYRLFHQVMNQFLVDALANNRAFQRFAVRSNEFFKDLSKKGLSSAQEFRRAFGEELRRNFVREASKQRRHKL